MQGQTAPRATQGEPPWVAEKRSAYRRLSGRTEAGGWRFAYPPYKDWRVYSASDPYGSM